METTSMLIAGIIGAALWHLGWHFGSKEWRAWREHRKSPFQRGRRAARHARRVAKELGLDLEDVYNAIEKVDWMKDCGMLERKGWDWEKNFPKSK